MFNKKNLSVNNNSGIKFLFCRRNRTPSYRFLNLFLAIALGGIRAEDEYSEPNKRHTMSHPPEHITDENNQAPAKSKISPKEKKKEKVKYPLLPFFFNLYVCK